MNAPVQFMVDENTLVFAFRYALGRASTAPSHMIAELKKHWPRLNSWTQAQIQKDIQAAIMTNDIGRSCDETTWREVLSWRIGGHLHKG